MNTINEEQAIEFKSLLEELRKQLLEASIHFDIWEQLWPTKGAVDILNRYKGFFLPTRNAHLDRFFIKVCNVLSNDPKSPSFYRIFKMLDTNPELAPGIDVRSLKRRLKPHREVLDGIDDYRNKRGAHWDMRTTAQRKPVLYGKSKRMLKELQDIFNEINSAHSGNTWSFKPIQHGDATVLLSVLKDRYHKPASE
jgi:hypothetical protein